MDETTEKDEAELSDDAVEELSHDHGHLSALVLTVRDAIRRMERGDRADRTAAARSLGAGVEALHHALLIHFAREEEALFPFVTAELPSMAAGAESLRGDHDAVCKAARDLLGLVRTAIRTSCTDESITACSGAAGVFEQLYADHSRVELAFLNDVGRALEPHVRAKLAALLETT